MSWLAAIPVVGSLFERIGEAIDRNVTTDHERLQAKNETIALLGPVLVALLEAEKASNELKARLLEAEIRAEDRLVRWRRPIISLLGTAHGCAGLWLYVAGWIPHEAAVAVMTFGGTIGGLDIASRGVEKTIAQVGLNKIPRRK